MGQLGEPEDDWLVDSGCTHHMCNSPSQMLTLEGVQEEKRVLLGNSTWAKVANVGSVELRVRTGQNSVASLRLDNVLLVPDLRKNLISVSCLMDSGIDIEFKGNQGTCSFIKGNETVGRANKVQNLWVLDTLKCGDGFTAQANLAGMGFLATKDQTLGLWHLRFNHLNEEDLKQLARTNAVRGLEMSGGHAVKGRCSGCALGKQHRDPFPQAEKRETKILELIHSDLIGPLPETIQTRKKWIMVLIDDCSRRSWVYLLASKDEVSETFQRWKKQVEKRTGAEVKTLRTDGGGEYINREFLEFLSEEGISKETTTPYSPQSNGVAERFNRTLLEGVRSMLHGSGMSKSFWGEAVLCFNHTANRTPKKGLKEGMTPYEAFYGVKPSVYHLRPFGCRVSIHTPDQLRRKLDPKSRPGVFLGYSLDKKAYRVWDKEKRQIVDSRDLIFYEDVLVNENLISPGSGLPRIAENSEDVSTSSEEQVQVGPEPAGTSEEEAEAPTPQQEEVRVEMVPAPERAEGPAPQRQITGVIRNEQLGWEGDVDGTNSPSLQGSEGEQPFRIGLEASPQSNSQQQEGGGPGGSPLALEGPGDPHQPSSADGRIGSEPDPEEEVESRLGLRRSVRDTKQPSRFTYRALGIPEGGDQEEDPPEVNVAEGIAFAASLCWES